MSIEAVEVKVIVDGQTKRFKFSPTNEAGERKDGKPVLLHFQPVASCAAIKPFSKLYIDVAALTGAKAKK